MSYLLPGSIILYHTTLETETASHNLVTDTYRSAEEQNQLYAQNKTMNGPKFTNATGGQSPHNYSPSFAIDVAFEINKKADWSEKYLRLFAPYMKSEKIEWGGTWKFLDLPHYEVRGWKALKK